MRCQRTSATCGWSSASATGLGGRLHPFQPLRQTHRPYREIVVMWGSHVVQVR